MAVQILKHYWFQLHKMTIRLLVLKKARTVKVKAKGVKISKAAAEADDVRLTPKQAARVRAEFCERVRVAYEAN